MKNAVVPVSAEPTEELMATAITQKYDAVTESLKTVVAKTLDLGATIAAAESVLLRQGKIKNSGNRFVDGVGMLGWLEKNCPSVNYKTAMRYKKHATDAAMTLGIDYQNALLLLQGRDEEVSAKIPKTVLKRREELFEAPSVRKLSQMCFNFAAEDRGKAGRPEGTAKAPTLTHVTDRDLAVKIFGDIAAAIPGIERVEAVVKELNFQETETFINLIGSVVDALKSHRDRLTAK